MVEKVSPESSPMDSQETPPHSPAYTIPNPHGRRGDKANPYHQQFTPVKEKQDQPVSDITSHHSSSLDSGETIFHPPKLSYADVLRRSLAPPTPAIKKEDQPLTEETSNDSFLDEDQPEEDSPLEPYDKEDEDSSKPQDEADFSFELSISFPRDTESYQLLVMICEGVRCPVYKALCIPLNTIVAVKVIILVDTDTPPDIDAIEAAIDSLPSHSSILKPYCTFIEGCQFWVVMPYIAGGSLLSIISHSGELPLKCIAMILETILNVLVSIHGRGISHRGIKPGNILLDYDGEILLSDFGTSASNWVKDVMLSRPEAANSVTPPYWVPPEAIADQSHFTPKSDIWCLGITAMEMFYGSPPIAFDTRIPKFMVMKFAKRFQYTCKYGSGKGNSDRIPSNSFRNFVESCLEIDYMNRPDAMKLLKHPFFSLCKGKGSSYLTSNVMVATLPSIERRPSARCADGPHFRNKYICMRKHIGWVLLIDEFEMKPIYLKGFVLQKNQAESEKSYKVISNIINAKKLNREMLVKGMLAVGGLVDEQVQEAAWLKSLHAENMEIDEK